MQGVPSGGKRPITTGSERARSKPAGSIRTEGSPSTLRRFPALPVSPHASPGRVPRVCITSQEFVRLHKNGGIGTAYTSLGEALARAGHDVTFLYTRSQHCETGTFDSVMAHYLQKGIRLEAVPGDVADDSMDAASMSHVSFRTYQWLKERDFDIVHFPEMGGIGYYCLLAKHQGLAFERTLLCVGTHSPTLWLNHANNQNIDEHWHVEADYMERSSVALADVVWSPSQYMLNWVGSQGWTLPESCYVQPYITSLEARGTGATQDGTRHPVSEPVFFGRLETRKGLAVFCDAMDLLVGSVNRPRAVTFLGRHGIVLGKVSAKYLEDRSAAWPWRTQVIDTYDQPHAIEYLRGANRLAVMASPVDNSPNTVYECLGERIPFIACRSGGIPELIAEEDAEWTTFDYEAPALAGLLERAVAGGIRVARPRVEMEPNERAWTSWHEQLPGMLPAVATDRTDRDASTAPLVSVCLSGYVAENRLRDILTAVGAQDHPRTEVVLGLGIDSPGVPAEDPTLEPLIRSLGCRLIRSETASPSEALNEAARQALGEYLLFVGERSVPTPGAISTLATAAMRGGADILTCAEEYDGTPLTSEDSSDPPDLALPIGAAAVVGVFRNCFGTSSTLVRREVFTQAGGFVEAPPEARSWEFYVRSVLSGHRLEVVPEILFRSRRKEAEMLTAPLDLRGQRQVLGPYAERLPEPVRDLIPLAHGMDSGAFGPTTERIIEYYEERIRLTGLIARGKLFAELGQAREACSAMRDAVEEARRSPNIALRLDVLLEAGKVYLDVGDAIRGRQVLIDALDTARRMRQKEHAESLKTMLDMLSRKMGFDPVR